MEHILNRLIGLGRKPNRCCGSEANCSMGGTNPNRPLKIAWVTTIYWVRKSIEPLLKILLQWKKISQGKNEHKSFLSSMISRRNYIELKKKKNLQLGENKSVRKSGKNCTRKK
ncbi:uncharacterized protein LOC142642558 [Castanea sativa]|uniref:uncharacterized protein LOC142642558 n=1 Tax=Castanea sativa TaxID=21020 RepID=UPI003F653DCA